MPLHGLAGARIRGRGRIVGREMTSWDVPTSTSAPRVHAAGSCPLATTPLSSWRPRVDPTQNWPRRTRRVTRLRGWGTSGRTLGAPVPTVCQSWTVRGVQDKAIARIVGREPEFAALGEFVEAEASVQALVLSGAPGIGKTTLWEAGIELAGQRGLRVLSA